MRLAEIDESGLILNVIEADQRPDWAQDWPDIGIAAGPGWSYIGGEFVAPQPPPVDIPAARVAAVRQINQRAGAVRALFVTDIPAQQMIYLAKEAEARRYVAASPEPATLDGYPWLAAEVGSTAPTAMGLATLWLSMAGMWTVMGTSIEQIRMGHINQMDHPEITIEVINNVLASAMAAFSQIAANAP